MERNKYHVSHPRADLHTDARVSPERPLRRPHSRFGCRRRHALVIHPPPPTDRARPGARARRRGRIPSYPSHPLTRPHRSRRRHHDRDRVSSVPRPSSFASASRDRGRTSRAPASARVGVRVETFFVARAVARARVIALARIVIAVVDPIASSCAGRFRRAVASTSSRGSRGGRRRVRTRKWRRRYR